MKKYILCHQHQVIHDAFILYTENVVGRSPKTAKDYTESMERYLPRFMRDRMKIEGVQSIYDIKDVKFMQQIHDDIIANKEWAAYNQKSHASTFTSGLKRYIEFYQSAYFPFKHESTLSNTEPCDELMEGNVYQSHYTGYERNPKARQICLEHYGYRCSVCGFDFEETYGELGKSFIEVHHVVPISSIGETYVVDPIRDLRPVCSNCHSMLHRHKPVLGVDELKKLIKKE